MEERERKDLVHQNVELATYAALFHLCVNGSFTSVMFYIEMAIRFIYHISFPLSLAVGNSQIFPIDGFLAIRELWTHWDNGLLNQVTSHLLGCFVLLNVFFVVFTIWFYRSKRNSITPPHPWSNIMYIHINWSCGPLFIPYITILLNYLNCLNPLTDACSIIKISLSEGSYLLAVAGVHVLFSALYSIVVFEWSPISHYPGTKAHTRACLFASFMRSCLAFSYGLVRVAALPLVILSLIVEILTFLFYWYEMPFYSIRSNQLVMVVHSISAMASFAVLLAILTAGSGDVVCIILLVFGGLLMIPCVQVLCRWRLQSIEAKPVHSLKTATDIDIRTRIGIQQLVKLTADEREYDTNEKSPKRMIMAALDDIFITHSKQMRNSFKFNLTWSTYLYLYKSNKFYGMQRLRQVDCQGSLWSLLPLQVRLRQFAENASAEEVEAGLISYEEQQRLERYAVDCLGKCLGVQLQFWGTLISGDYSLQVLEKMADRIHFLSEASRTSLQRMIFLNPKSAFYRRLYAQFLSSIFNDDAGAKRQLSRAVELESEEDTSQHLTDSSNCILIMSGEKDNLGQILEANNKSCLVFGAASEDLIGRKVNMLMARPFAVIHDRKLTEYIENKTQSLSTIVRTMTVLKSSNGFVFEGDLRVREYSNFTLDPSIAFFGSIIPHKPRNFCVVKISDLIVWDVSSLFFSTFNPDMGKVKNYEWAITNILPQLKDRVEDVKLTLAAQQAYPLEFLHQSGDKKLNMLATIAPLRYFEKEYWKIAFDVAEPLRKGEFGAQSNQNNEAFGSGLIPQSDGSLGEDPREKKGPTRREGRKVVVGFQKETEIKNKPFSMEDESQSSANESSDEEAQRNQKMKEWTKDVSGYHSTSDDDDDDVGSEEGSGSVEDKESKTSSQSSKSINLLRFGLLRTKTTWGNQLRYLLACIALLLLLLCSMSICVLCFSSLTTINRYQATLNLLDAELPSSLSIASYAAMIFNHLLLNTLYSPALPQFSNNVTQMASIQQDNSSIRGTLNKFTVKMNAIKDLLYQNNGQLLPSEEDLIRNSLVSVTNYDGSVSQVTTLELIHMYNVAINSVSNQNLPTMLQDRRFVDFLLSNSGFDVDAVPLWNTFCQTIINNNEASNQHVETIELIIAITAICLVVLVTVMVFFPSIYWVMKQRVEVFSMFERMEQGNLRDIYSQCLGKLNEVEGTEFSSNNLEIQDMMEVISSKKTEGARTSKLHIKLSRVVWSYATLALSLIMVATIIFFLGYHLWWANFTEQNVKGVDTRVFLGGSRDYYIRELARHSLGYNFTTGMFQLDTQRMQEIEVLLQETDHALYYGDPSMGVPQDIRIYTGGQSILEESVCQQFLDNGIPITSSVPCSSVLDGILNQGPHDVVILYLGLSENLRKTYQNYVAAQSNATLALSAKSLFVTRLLELRNLNDVWLTKINRLFVLWFTNTFQTNFANAAMYCEIATAIYIAVLLLLLLIVYIPMVTRMNNDLLRSRMMLMLIPPEMIESRLQLKEQIRTIALRMIQSV